MDRVVFRKVDSGKGEGEFRGLDRGLVGDVSWMGPKDCQIGYGKGREMMFMIKVRYQFAENIVIILLEDACVSRKTEAKINKGLEKVGGLRFMIGEQLKQEKQRNSSKP